MADEEARETRVVESDATVERGLVSEFLTAAADAGIIEAAQAGLGAAMNLVTGGGQSEQSGPAAPAVEPAPASPPGSSDL